MRALLLCTIFGALSTAAHAAAPQCTLPNAGAIEVADRREQPAPPPSAASQSAPPQTLQPAASEAPAEVPASLAGLPFVQHVAAAGAVVSDLGSSHGMHSIAARNGDQFMIFQITPDGQAAVSGALTELTSAQTHDRGRRQRHAACSVSTGWTRCLSGVARSSKCST